MRRTEAPQSNWSPLGTIARGAAQLAVAAIVARLLNLGFRYLVARHTAVEAYGAFALAASIINYGAIAGTMNLGQAAARFIPILNASARAFLMRRIAAIATASVTLATAFSVLVSVQLQLPAVIVALCVVGVVALSASNVLEGVLRGSDLIGSQAINQVLVSASRLAAALALAMVAGPVFPSLAPVSLFVCALSLGVLYPLLVLSRVHRSPVELETVAPSTGELLRFAALLTGANLCTTGVGFVNRLLLSRYASYSDVAHYDNGLLAYGAFQTLLASFVLAGIPHYARLGDRAPVEVLGIRRLMSAFLIAYAALSLPEVLHATQPILASLGISDYAPFYPIFLVLLLGFPFEFIFVSISGPLQARSRVGLVAACAIAAAVFSLSVGALLIPRFGVIGATVSTLSNAVVLAAAAMVARSRAKFELVNR